MPALTPPREVGAPQTVTGQMGTGSYRDRPEGRAQGLQDEPPSPLPLCPPQQAQCYLLAPSPIPAEPGSADQPTSLGGGHWCQSLLRQEAAPRCPQPPSGATSTPGSGLCSFPTSKDPSVTCHQVLLAEEAESLPRDPL